eukprot:s111_g53.t1
MERRICPLFKAPGSGSRVSSCPLQRPRHKFCAGHTVTSALQLVGGRSKMKQDDIFQSCLSSRSPPHSVWNTGAALREQLKSKSWEKNRKGLEFCLVLMQLSRQILVENPRIPSALPTPEKRSFRNALAAIRASCLT